ncbi:MAG: acetyltransferase [Rhodothermales bacterium]
MKKLVIVGAGGLGRETAALVEAINAAGLGSWEIVGFADDDAALHGTRVQGLPVRGNVASLVRERDLYYVLAVGASRVRRQLGGRLAEAPLEAATLIHPSVDVHPTTRIGPGTMLCQGVALTVSIMLGRHVILNLNSTVGHDAYLADYATAHPGAHVSGFTRIGTAAELGARCVVLPGISVGEETIVGAGAVVNRDLPERCTAVGVPARPIVR